MKGLNSFRMNMGVKSSNDDQSIPFTINQPISSLSSFRQNHYQQQYMPSSSSSSSSYNLPHMSTNTAINEFHNIQMRLLHARNKNIAMKKTLVQAIQSNINTNTNSSNDNSIRRSSNIDNNNNNNNSNSNSNIPKKVSIQEVNNDDDDDDNNNYKRDKKVTNVSMKSNKDTRKQDDNNTIRSNKQSSKKFMEKPQDIDSDNSDIESPSKIPPRLSSRRDNAFSPKTPQNNARIADLAIIADQMSRAINDNKSILAPKIDTDKEKLEIKVSIDAEKKRYRAVLESRDESHDVMPMWRHRMRGRFNPPPSLVLKGKRLFIVVVWGIIIFYARPYTCVLREKKKNRDRNTVELKKNITMFADGCDDWLGQLVRVTISSVENDTSLDFEPTDSFVNNRNMPLKQRILQLKIRVKSIIDSITSSQLPSHFIDLLVSMIDDGNYFFKEFLFEYETKLLDFDSLGGTRNMLILPRSDYNYNGKPKVLFEVGFGRSRIDALKGRTLIQNFILIKILISHILLSPWNFGVAKKPTNNINRLVNNHRVLATVIYEILRLVDPEIPAIEQVAISQISEENYDEGNDEKKPTTEGENNDAGEQQYNDAAKIKKIDEEDSRFEKFVGILLGRTKKSKEIASNSIEERILGHRSAFCSLQEIHNLLLPSKSLDDVRKETSGWMLEFANKLEEWINNSIQTVLNRRHAIIRQDIGGDDNAESMLGSLTARRGTARGAVVPKLELNFITSSRT